MYTVWDLVFSNNKDRIINLTVREHAPLLTQCVTYTVHLGDSDHNNWLIGRKQRVQIKGKYSQLGRIKTIGVYYRAVYHFYR